MRPRASVDQLGQDLRHAARLLWKAPWFTFASVFVLAVGIGATTAIFGLVDAVLLRPLPVKDAGQLVMVWESSPRAARNLVSPPTFLDWEQQNHVFATVAATAGIPSAWPLVHAPRPIPQTVMSETGT